jgi:hypothetical protein
MGFWAERAMPVTLGRSQGLSIRQEGAARRGQISQGAMRQAQTKAQTMPSEKRHRPRPKPPSRISAQPPSLPSGKAGFRLTGFAKNRITGQATSPWVI